MGMMDETDSGRDTIEIHDLSSSGDGVGKGTDGRTLFVPLTAPGDRVGVRMLRQHKRYGHAVVEAIERAAPDRVTPGCPLFGECGGCDWQHMTYQRQVASKAHIVQQALLRVGQISWPLPVMYAAPDEYHTRSRARLPVSSDQRPGFFRRGSRDIVEVDHCPVFTDSLNLLQRALFRHLPALPFQVEHVRLLGTEAELAVSLHVDPDKPKPMLQNERIIDWCKALQAQLSSTDGTSAQGAAPALLLRGISWWRGRTRLGGWEDPWVLQGEPAIAYRPEGFAQASFLCNDTLVARVLALLGDVQGERIVELYAGRGNLSLPLARQGATVLALELDQQALVDGRDAAARAGLSAQVSFQRFHDTTDKLAELCQRHGHATPQRLLLDPPRQGLSSEVCDQIIAMGPAQILYVSCDPATLARDLRKLSAAGYQLQALEVVDLMPQTAHVESLALLQYQPPLAQ